MNKSAYLILISLTIGFCTNTTSFAQTGEMDPDSYKSQKEELLSRKEILLREKSELTNEIAGMTIHLEELEAKLMVELPKYFVRKYGKADGSRVAMGQIWKGMSEQMMRDSWGEPEKTNTDKYSYGVFKQLYYGKVIYFFRDNKLIDWEEEK